MERTDPDVRVVYLKLPILGARSSLIARAALAAERRNAYALLRQTLMDNVYRAPGGITSWMDLGYPYKVVPNENNVYPNR